MGVATRLNGRFQRGVENELGNAYLSGCGCVGHGGFLLRRLVMEYIFGVVGFWLGWAAHIGIGWLVGERQRIAKLKRSQAAKKGRKKKEELALAPKEARRVNGSGTVDSGLADPD